MEIYIARQPILNRSQEVVAYELLYRSSNKNEFPNIDGNEATSHVIYNFLQMGIDSLSEGKPSFINFTDQLIENHVPSHFEQDTIVVEILESVELTDSIIEGCTKLKEMGYKLALDDFQIKLDNPYLKDIIGLVDIIKVDIHNTPRDLQKQILRAFKSHDVEFLAEKVETREEYERCLQEGYSYFQGYFFSKPVVLSMKDIPIQNHSFLLILNELSQPEPSVDRITKYIEADVSLSYKLLRFINSPIIGRKYDIKSIKQAVVILGFKELKKWIFLLSLREKPNREDSYNEVIRMSLIRAKTCEEIANYKGFRTEASSFFLVGLLSLMDTLMKQSPESLMEGLPLDSDIKQTILGEDTRYSSIFHLAVSLERVEWIKIDRLIQEIDMDKQALFDIYMKVLKWAREVMNGLLI
ncbi:HDOD domain-containing protein [Oceanobacillus piezotolerans]|uniref:HDOD domain-containing protein n=1 Tax=Oceanobacillus piezotolerans TaxID=2448030 RepID=A0A498D6B2_9BACI|nr:HDOD domain-containing protein [Oceanobacillus piezotolerans]RLL42694.1 HDOD domain-containing protein [Oceanobacillus piezotolerans]